MNAGTEETRMRMRGAGARWMAGAGVAMLVAGCASAAAPGPAAVADGAWITYRCESGRDLAASYPADSIAFVRYAGATREMRVATSASGARYTGDGYEWWTRGTGPGSTGRLARFVGDEVTASQPLESCTVPGGD
ncbi:MliC family protein [Longimicrobium sp.]|uniref:MliC family protein n=1 Tax=Longimicrobium sp. TaxID=2029185 RepID=UPI002E30318B|nr:MliC family protein [Longimicrobium sp.]HEX6039197.1 MliC family protein [Longimicrobium sp.]